jgi:enoyl-CoA hydratase/carnithine racemase
MNSREYSLITASAAGEICTLTLNNPARRNAIGAVMVNELLWALADAEEASEVRTIVLTGSGAHFSAGGDFSQMQVESALGHRGDYADLLLALCNCSKPTIARVNGVAMGGGLGLMSACTFAIAQSEAMFATPEVNVGLFPMMIMAVLARHVPKRRLMEMMLLGEKFNATRALELGLLSHVVDAAALDAAVSDLAHKLASKSPITLRLGLAAFRAQEDLALEAALPLLRGRLGECLGTEDASEGLSAFLEKRTPQWKGR